MRFPEKSRKKRQMHFHPDGGNVFDETFNARHPKEGTMSTVEFRPLHPLFCAEVTVQGTAGKPLDLRQVHDHETLTELRDGMDKYGVLVFPRQPFTNQE